MFHEYVYAGVPPVGVTVADPCPLPQLSATVTDVSMINSEGSVIVAITVSVHPLKSVITTVSVPATRFVAVGTFPAVPAGNQV